MKKEKKEEEKKDEVVIIDFTKEATEIEEDPKIKEEFKNFVPIL